MKEIRAFMHVEDYYTYRAAMEGGNMTQLGNEHTVKTLEKIITEAVDLLV
jgi:hypothetical protein